MNLLNTSGIIQNWNDNQIKATPVQSQPQKAGGLSNTDRHVIQLQGPEGLQTPDGAQGARCPEF